MRRWCCGGGAREVDVDRALRSVDVDVRREESVIDGRGDAIVDIVERVVC